MAEVNVVVPDIGSHEGVPVIEILVKPGDTIAKDQGLITLESDKATMEVPSTVAGVIKSVSVALGQTLNTGDLVAVVEVAQDPSAGNAAAPADSHDSAAPAPTAASPAPATAPAQSSAAAPAPAATAVTQPAAPPAARASAAPTATSALSPAAASTSSPAARHSYDCDVAVIGSGPGGYTAAFRAADLGLDVVLIERNPTLGGVCLNVGCIPSKALLHAAEVIDHAAHAKDMGITFGSPKIELDGLRGYKNKVVGSLTQGLAGMAKQRKVRVMRGSARFATANTLAVTDAEGNGQTLSFNHCIIAAGSEAVHLPGFPWDDPRVMDSTGALELNDVPKKLLVVGGGIIGLEMATVYQALGSDVTVVELAPQLIPGADADLVRPLAQRLKAQKVAVHLKTKVVEARAEKKGIRCVFEGDAVPAETLFDRVLVAVGRSANGKTLACEKAGVTVNERGFIPVDNQMRTSTPNIFAIGDLVGQPMLAHKATHEGKLAAEVIAGEKKAWVARVIPSVAYTNPEIAWVGVTENEAKEKGLKVGVGKFPWAASGRALSIGRSEGFTKLIFDEDTHRVIGCGIVGPHAGELISEAALAIEMGCEASDLGHTIHPHPTLGETVCMAAEMYEGTITDLYLPKRK